MFRILYCLLAGLATVHVNSQTFTIEREQEEILDGKEKYLLTWSSAKNQSIHRYKLSYIDKGGKQKYAVRLDSVIPLLKESRTVRQIAIRFPSRDTGFVYGHYVSYGWVSFLYRTLNGGRSWERVFDFKYRTALKSDQFLMFNSLNGVMIQVPENENYFHCLVTNDAGMTWNVSSTLMGFGLMEHGWPTLDVSLVATQLNEIKLSVEKNDGKGSVMHQVYIARDQFKDFYPVKPFKQ